MKEIRREGMRGFDISNVFVSYLWYRGDFKRNNWSNCVLYIMPIG
jgi:hypothetical protein